MEICVPAKYLDFSEQAFPESKVSSDNFQTHFQDLSNLPPRNKKAKISRVFGY